MMRFLRLKSITPSIANIEILADEVALIYHTDDVPIHAELDVRIARPGIADRVHFQQIIVLIVPELPLGVQIGSVPHQHPARRFVVENDVPDINIERRGNPITLFEAQRINEECVAIGHQTAKKECDPAVSR
jgi:hypothetical protein